MTLALIPRPTLPRSFRDVPIRRKLLAITMVTTAAALLVAGAGIVLTDSYLFRGYLERDLDALAHITSDNTTAALKFEDPATASEILHALRARPHLLAACIYRPNGTVLAEYIRRGSKDACPPADTRNRMWFTDKNLMLTRPVMLQERPIGSLTIEYDLAEIGERTRLYSGAVLSVFLASSLIAFLISARLRGLIATPLAQLVQATTAVSETGDYGIRAKKFRATNWAFWWMRSMRCWPAFRAATRIWRSRTRNWRAPTKIWNVLRSWPVTICRSRCG